MAAVSLVGSGLTGRPAVWSAAEAALAAANIEAGGWFAADGSITAVVAPESCDAAVRALHAALVEV